MKSTKLTLMKTCFISTMMAVSAAAMADTVTVYGPGGPAPAMKAVVSAFEKETGHQVVLTAGPAKKWIEQAKNDGDVIFSGSEHMMTDLTKAMDGKIQQATIEPLYLRPLSMLVRPGNPKKIKKVTDLTKDGVKILVVNGSGQTGAWEDMASRKGNIETVRKIRHNIVSYADNSGIARDTWQKDSSIDVWLIWNIWQISNPNIAEIVPISKDYAIYRDMGVALTQKGESNATAKQFIQYLKSPQAEVIFKKWGWSK